MEIGGESALKISDEFLRGGVGGGSFDAEEVVNLTNENYERDARGETVDHGGGDESDEASEAQQTDEKQKDA